MVWLMCIVMALSPVGDIENRAIEIASSHDSVVRCECIYIQGIAYVAMVTVPLRVSDRQALVEDVENALYREGISHRVMIDDGAYYLIKRTKENQDYTECLRRLGIIYERRH